MELNKHRVNPINLAVGSIVEIDPPTSKFDPDRKCYTEQLVRIIDIIQTQQGWMLKIEKPNGDELKFPWCNAWYVIRVVEYHERKHPQHHNWLMYPLNDGSLTPKSRYHVTDLEGWLEHVVYRHPRYVRHDVTYDFDRLFGAFLCQNIHRELDERRYPDFIWSHYSVDRKRLFRWLDQNLNRFIMPRKKAEKLRNDRRKAEEEANYKRYIEDEGY